MNKDGVLLKEIAYDNRAADRVLARIKAGEERLIPHDEVTRKLPLRQSR